MLNWIDNLLNRITMYKLVSYVLMAYLLQGLILSLWGVVAFKPWDLAVSVVILTLICWLANTGIGQLLKIPTNSESYLITALILALIITPPAWGSANFAAGLAFLAWASVWAMASKFLLTWRGKHIFNPAAFAVALTAFTIGHSASWWVGTLPMLPLVAVGGLLIVRKIQRFDAVWSFLIVALAGIFATSISRHDPADLLRRIFADTPIVFFATIMLIEPLTLPSRRGLRLAYGALVGAIFAPAIHIGSIYTSPELSLLTANLIFYLIEPKGNFLLTLTAIEPVGTDTYDFVFRTAFPLPFRAGQYLECTLPHPQTDSRGNRRYFTIASAPSEAQVRLGVKFYDQPSSFKRRLLKLPLGTQMLGGHPVGDFTLPKDPGRKLAFIAGGIGITPFRSMIRHLLDQQQPRDIALFYSNRPETSPAYADWLRQAQDQLPLRVVFTDLITPEMIQSQTPDYLERTFYLSGPRSLVTAFERTLKSMGIKRRHIKIDFFPGYA